MAINDYQVNTYPVDGNISRQEGYVYAKINCDIESDGTIDGHRIRTFNSNSNIVINTSNIYTNLIMGPTETLSITALVKCLVKTAMEGFCNTHIQFDVFEDIQRIVDSITNTTIEFVKEPIVNHVMIYRKGKPGIGFLQYSIVYYMTGQIIIKKDPYL